MKKERRTPRHFDDQFRLSVLKDYYESGASYSQISRKYDVSSGNVIAWEIGCPVRCSEKQMLKSPIKLQN